MKKPLTPERRAGIEATLAKCTNHGTEEPCRWCADTADALGAEAYWREQAARQHPYDFSGRCIYCGRLMDFPDVSDDAHAPDCPWRLAQ